MKVKYCFKLFSFFIVLFCFSHLCLTEQIKALENDIFQIREINLGYEKDGVNIFSSVVLNRTDFIKNFCVDIRTEGKGFGRGNWQRQYFFRLQPHETKKIQVEYNVFPSIMSLIILRFGEAERYIDVDEWIKLPPENRAENPLPDVQFHWTKIISPKKVIFEKNVIENIIARHSIFLNHIANDLLSKIKLKLSDLIKQSREEKTLRKKLYKLFLGEREYSKDFNYRRESWKESYSFLNSIFEKEHLFIEPFSIKGEKGNRITAFFASCEKEVNEKKPIILLLSGNPPGTKESLVGHSVFFSKLGYHTMSIDTGVPPKI